MDHALRPPTPRRPCLCLAALILAMPLALLAGCAVTAPIAPDIAGQATPVDFRALAADPERFRGETLILGGQIIETIPMDGGTQITVLETQTDGDERPQGPETSQGRFMARAQGFLDPEVYRAGRQVTVAGTVAGREMAPLGRTQYAYPLIDAQQVYLWPPPEPRYNYPYYPYGPYYYDYWPYYYPGPFFGPPLFFPGRFRGGGGEEHHEQGAGHEMGEHESRQPMASPHPPEMGGRPSAPAGQGHPGGGGRR